jgi:t-SNARE complex subunit (syntaxin)
VVVEEQSALLDNIEFQTRAAKEYINDGVDDTAEAVNISKKIRKKRCFVLVVALLLTFGILLFLKMGG